MRVRILPSAPGETSGYQYLTSFLVENVIAIDAGCLGLFSASRDSAKPGHIFLTHAHIDHVGTLPIFLENGHGHGNVPVRIYGPSAALKALRDHFFNSSVWVDYALLSEGGTPWIELRAMAPGDVVAVDGLRVTAAPVAHTVPTFGYVVDDGSSAVAFGADSGPTDDFWEIARATGRLRAAFVECSFPNSLQALATRTGHLTPGLWALELRKLPREAVVIAVHIKPRYREEVIAELSALGDVRLEIGEVGREYTL